jgi:hypothetical protein
MNAVCTLIALASFCLPLLVSSAEADPLILTGGGFRWGGFGETELRGAGFELRAQTVAAGEPACANRTCRPGDQIRLGLHYGPGEFGTATGTVDGEFFGFTVDPVEGFLIGDLTMAGPLTFQTSSLTIPAFPAHVDPDAIGEIRLSAPFRLSGFLTLRRRDGSVAFDRQISGRGTASLGLDAFESAGTHEFILDDLNFTFGESAPVPEPSTAALLTFGGLCLIGVVRRRRCVYAVLPAGRVGPVRS